MSKEEEYSIDEILSVLKEKNYKPELSDYFSRCIPFHTYPAPGLLIGIFMVDYALDLLKATPGEKIYATCETNKCAPDPLQVITHCTIGNHRLQIIQTGRFALTMNRSTIGDFAEGVRIYIDKEKLVPYHILDLWYRNSPEFDKRSMVKPLLDEILTAGREILSSQKVRIPVTHKQKWRSTTCPGCKEMIPEDLMHEGLCPGCGSSNYYQVIE